MCIRDSPNVGVGVGPVGFQLYASVVFPCGLSHFIFSGYLWFMALCSSANRKSLTGEIPDFKVVECWFLWRDTIYFAEKKINLKLHDCFCNIHHVSVMCNV